MATVTPLTAGGVLSEAEPDRRFVLGQRVSFVLVEDAAFSSAQRAMSGRSKRATKQTTRRKDRTQAELAEDPGVAQARG